MKKQSFKSKKLTLKKFEISKINSLNEVYGGVLYRGNEQMASGPSGVGRDLCYSDTCGPKCKSHNNGGI